MSDEQLLFFNGINGASGEYDLPPMTGGELSTFIRGCFAPEKREAVRARLEYRQQKDR